MDIKKAIEQVNKCMRQGCGQMNSDNAEFIGLVIKGLETLQKLDDGKIVELPPCKVGDIVYEIDMPEYGVIECEVTRIQYVEGYLCGVKDNGRSKSATVYIEVIEGHGKGSCYHFEQGDFGKTVFLTKEEAAKEMGK